MHISGHQDGIVVVISDETTDITTGAAKVTMRMPYAFRIKQVKASLTTASSSGTPTFDVNVGGVSIFSTRPTIDANETSTDSAAVPSVLTSTPLLVAANAEVTFDIDVAGTGAKGAKIYLIEGVLS